jgi:hypothetical protein
MCRSAGVASAVLVVVAAAWLLWPKKKDQGNARFFDDQTYYFEAIRVLTDTGPAGGASGEAAEAISHIKAGDADSWYTAWDAEGDRVSSLAATIQDRFTLHRHHLDGLLNFLAERNQNPGSTVFDWLAAKFGVTNSASAGSPPLGAGAAAPL